jgi:DNA-binding response OmpR family regulator
MAFSLGADDYMVKPFSPRDLVSRVTSAIRRRGELIASGDTSVVAQTAEPFTIVEDLA